MDLAGNEEYLLGRFESDVESQPLVQPLSSSCSSAFWLLPEMPLQRSISAEADMFYDLDEQIVPHHDYDIGEKKKAQIEGVVMGQSYLRDQQDQEIKRTRCAEVHNLSERRRRDRINGKVRTLQELIPHCYKKDKASILEDAAEYIKTLKLQLEMIRGGECGVEPNINSPTPRPSTFMPIRPGIGLGQGMGLGMASEATMLGGLSSSTQYAPILQLPLTGLEFSASPVGAYPFPSVPTTTFKANFQQVPEQYARVVAPLCGMSGSFQAWR